MYPVNLWLQKNQNDSQVTMAQQSLRSLFRFKSVTLSPVFNASCRACRSQLPMQSRLGGGDVPFILDPSLIFGQNYLHEVKLSSFL